jgi:hypothetical protein
MKKAVAQNRDIASVCNKSNASVEEIENQNEME